MADAEEPKKKSFLPIILYAVLVVASGGAGYAYSKLMLPPPQPVTHEETASEEPVTPAEGEAHGTAPTAHGQISEKPLEEQITHDLVWRDLNRITTNIGDPENVWVRVELSMATTSPVEDLAVAEIGEDILAYFRTVKLVHLKSPSGFRHIMGDIKEIANVRTGGVVFDVFPKAVVFE